MLTLLLAPDESPALAKAYAHLGLGYCRDGFGYIAAEDNSHNSSCVPRDACKLACDALDSCRGYAWSGIDRHGHCRWFSDGKSIIRPDAPLKKADRCIIYGGPFPMIKTWGGNKTSDYNCWAVV